MMETVRDKWTDERLDDLNHRMDEGFGRLHQDLRDLRSEISTVRSEIGGEVGSLRAEMNTRFDALQRTLIQVGGGMAAAFGAALIGLIATQL